MKDLNAPLPFRPPRISGGRKDTLKNLQSLS